MKEIRVVVFCRDAVDQISVMSALAEDAAFEVVGGGGNPDAAASTIRDLNPDLAILSAEPPGMGGFDAIDSLSPADRPATVFVATRPDQAARAFDLAAMDFLVSPVDGDRLRVGLARAKTRLRQENMDDLEERLWRLLKHAIASGGQRNPNSSRWPARLSLKVEGDFHIVAVRDVIWVEAQRDVVKVCVAGQVRVVRESLQQFEKRLDPTRFPRIHRSFIVNLDHVERISGGRGGESTLWMTDGTKIPASRTSRPSLAALTGHESDQLLEFARAFEFRPQEDGPAPNP